MCELPGGGSAEAAPRKLRGVRGTVSVRLAVGRPVVPLVLRPLGRLYEIKSAVFEG